MQPTDILFIIPPFHTRHGGGSFFPLSISYLISAVVANGYSWEVINCTSIIDSFYSDDLAKLKTKLLDDLQNYSPRIIGIGPCITSQLKSLKIITDCCKSVLPGIPILAGGPLATIKEQEWVFYEYLGINYIVKGDGEVAVPNAIRSIIENGVLDNCLVSTPEKKYINIIDDLNSILFPFRGFHSSDVFSERRSGNGEQAAMITSRGCPYSCNYCVSGNLVTSQRIRRRSIDNSLLEIVEIKSKYGINDIVFYDDCFFYKANDADKEVAAFCNAVLKNDIDFKWQIELRPDFFVSLSDASIRLLETSGCRQINLGIEKVSDKGLDFLGKANSIAGLKEKIDRIKALSQIQLSGTFILGGEAETEEDIKSLVSQSKEFGLDFAHYNPLFVYPGTPLYEKVFDNPRAWVDIITNDDLPWGEIVYDSKIIKRDQLLALVDFAYTEFYSGSEFESQEMIVDRFNIKREV